MSKTQFLLVRMLEWEIATCTSLRTVSSWIVSKCGDLKGKAVKFCRLINASSLDFYNLLILQHQLVTFPPNYTDLLVLFYKHFSPLILWTHKMSSRQLRKLQQQRELERAKLQEQQPAEEKASEGEEEEGETPPINKPSLFANFAALQADEDQNDDSDAGEQQIGQHPSDNEQPTSPSSGKKPKKARKKKKNKKQTEGNKLVSGHPILRSDGQRDEIDAALQELSLKRESNSTNTTTPEVNVHPEFARTCELLGINTQYLKVANEMRNLFGRAAVDNHDDAGGQIPRGTRRRQRAAQRQVDLETALKGHHAPGKGLAELTLRRNPFIQGKDDWPRATTGGLTMEISEDQQPYNGIVVFRFMHNQVYDQVQQQFHVFVEMGDPQNLIGLLQRNRT